MSNCAKQVASRRLGATALKRGWVVGVNRMEHYIQLIGSISLFQDRVYSIDGQRNCKTINSNSPPSQMEYVRMVRAH
jgi:hypothetical protein